MNSNPPQLGKIKVTPFKVNISQPSSNKPSIKPPAIGLRQPIISKSADNELAQKLEKFERYYGKKFTKDTPIHVLENAIHEANIPAQELDQAKTDESMMSKLVDKLNQLDKRVEVCKNFSKAQVLAKLKELQGTADLFEEYQTER